MRGAVSDFKCPSFRARSWHFQLKQRINMKPSHKDLDNRLKRVDALAQELDLEIFQKLVGFEGNTVTFTGRQFEIIKELGQIRTPAGFKPDNHITGICAEIYGRLKSKLDVADFLRDFKEGLRNHGDKYDLILWVSGKQRLVEIKSLTKDHCWFSNKQVAESPADILVIVQVLYSKDGKSITCQTVSVSEFQKLRKNKRFEKSWNFREKQLLNPKHLEPDPDFKFDGISEMFSGPAMMPLPKPKKTRSSARKKSNRDL